MTPQSHSIAMIQSFKAASNKDLILWGVRYMGKFRKYLTRMTTTGNARFHMKHFRV